MEQFTFEQSVGHWRNKERYKPLNRSIMSNEIKAVIESPKTEKPRIRWSHCRILSEL
jgi:hypothetical protein